MSTQEVKDLEKQGFLLVKKIHIWLAVITMLLAGVAQVVLGFNMIKDHETRIVLLEKEDKNKHDLLNEIKYNLRSFIEANGQRYIELSAGR